uniref:Myosin motor domain-containing protein n=1 Tax=viral metagenome TaxID=1070528 RepID=A0A6C0LYX8_9ZZZZ
MNQNQLCWIKIDEKWEKGEIINKKDDNLVINIGDNNIEVKIFSDEILFRNTDKEDNCNNLIELIHLNEPSILNNICLRYKEDNIYTFNGNILIAINPFKKLDIYHDKNIKNYAINNFQNLLPHPFYIGKQSLENIKTGQNQTILVSGESGAGKTQTTKYLMNYITNISNKSIDNLENKILASNPILEAFGNAKTIRNDNSSRFGKFIKLLFKDNTLCGAEINTYLLEKIRITKLSNNERNFHIFYMLINGFTKEKKRKYHLDNILDYNYLKRSNIISRNDGVNDDEMFKELEESFNTLNFNEDEIDNIYKIVSAILQLGNVEKLDNILNNSYLINYCDLMGFPINNIINIFQYRYIEVNGETIEISNKQEDFIVIRDTLSQLIYCLLFEYLVKKINSSIKSESENFIGILDIFGFEVFKNNGFEQLCINYTNEKLQSIFNKFIFQLEQEEYIKEQIEWKDISYPDNLNIIKLFENKKGGLFGLLQEQCILKSGNDKGLYSLLVKNLDNKPNLFVNSRDKAYQRFTIEHYAGKVEYTVDNFIHKNRNKIETRFQDLINNGSEFIQQFNLDIFNQNDKGHKTKSLIYQFRNSLNDLLKIISSTRQHYIRCIKPNDVNTANNFDKSRVLEQLKYCGVLEAIKIARAGYPIRIKKKKFIDHFYTFMNNSNINLDINNIANFIEKSSEVEKNDYQLGNTKVFLKKHIYDELILRNRLLVNTKAIIIQKNILSWYYKSRWYKIKKLKTLIRLYKKYYIEKNRNATKIVCIYRSYYIRKQYINYKKRIILIQSIFRMNEGKKIFVKITNSIKLQSFIRMYFTKKDYLLLRDKHRYSKIIQRSFHKYKNRQLIFKKIKELLNINNRCALLEKMLEEERVAREQERVAREQERNAKEQERVTMSGQKFASKIKDIDNLGNNLENNFIENGEIILKHQKILDEKNAKIEALLNENNRLKNDRLKNDRLKNDRLENNSNNIINDNNLVNIPLVNSEINDVENETFINYEIANKMEQLYLQLSQAQEQLKNMKKNQIPKNKGFFDVIKGFFK